MDTSSEASGPRLSRDIVASSSTALSGGDKAIDASRRIAFAEHTANAERLRRAIIVGGLVWPGFIVADWLMAEFIHPGELMPFLLARFGFWPVIIVGAWRLGRAPLPSPRALRVIDAIVFGGAGSAVTLMCSNAGGLGSPYATGVILVMFCRSAFVVERWQRGLMANGIVVASFPAMLIVSSLFVPELRPEWSSSAALAGFALNICFLLGALVFVVVAGHSAWALRREVFEARSIGRYRLKTLLGRGGMGEVWVAHHTGLRRDVALKVLRPNVAAEAEAVQRFEREVAATTELVHPNTVRVFDYGMTEDGIWYYAMELLEGSDLRSLVAYEGALVPERALHFAQQAASALAEAHQVGIVHRDIKPENLFITRAGLEGDFLKVLDFGIAKTNDAQDSGLTRTGAIVGTPAYMSPEAARGRAVDARSDVYALGAVMYFMLTGTPPFTAEGTADLLLAHVGEQAEAPSQRAGKPLPADFEAVILRCLEKQPERRFGSGSELADALAQCVGAGTWRVKAESTIRPKYDPAAPTLVPDEAAASSEVAPLTAAEAD